VLFLCALWARLLALLLSARSFDYVIVPPIDRLVVIIISFSWHSRITCFGDSLHDILHFLDGIPFFYNTFLHGHVEYLLIERAGLPSNGIGFY